MDAAKVVDNCIQTLPSTESQTRPLLVPNLAQADSYRLIIFGATQEGRLQELEVIIEKGLQTFVEVGQALLEIRDSKLYREEFRTFEEYCREKWGLKQSRAYQYIDAAKVVGNLQSSTIVELPATESQTRLLLWQICHNRIFRLSYLSRFRLCLLNLKPNLPFNYEPKKNPLPIGAGLTLYLLKGATALPEALY